MSSVSCIQPSEQVADAPQESLVTWNETCQNESRRLCVHELVQAQAKRVPEAVAVVSLDCKLSYRELNGRASQLARYLRGLGVGPETLVGVCLERSPKMVIGLLAVLKAGAAYVPLDPAYPQARLAFMLQDARATALLTQEKLLDRLPDGPHVICLDAGWHEIAHESDENLDNSVLADHPAYVIYTSGSTGQPKGVQIAHGSLLNLILWHQSAFRVSPDDRASQLAGLGFDASVWEMWPYLTAGAGIYLPDEETRLSPLRLQEWLADAAGRKGARAALAGQNSPQNAADRR
jgi:non-ribosomal peptide synthetase component F